MTLLLRTIRLLPRTFEIFGKNLLLIIRNNVNKIRSHGQEFIDNSHLVLLK